MKFLSQTWKIIALFVVSGLASGQDYPSKPVRVILAFSPGGPTDLVARPLAQKLTEMMGKPFLVEYKPGGNATIGTDFVAKSSSDGYTLMLFSSGHTLNPSTQKTLPYDTIKDFMAVSPIARGDVVLVANPKLQAKNVQELISLAKAQPGKLNFASSGTGGSLHLAGELLNFVAGINMTHIPFKGAGPALQAVISGTTELTFISAAPAVSQIAAEKVRLLGVASPRRSASFPNIPTIEEQGLPKFEIAAGYGVIAPSSTPPATINQLNVAIAKVISMPDIKQLLSKLGLTPWYLKAEELQAWMKNDVETWQRVTKAINYQPQE